MSARDSCGNQVWLLNEDPAPQMRKSPVFGEPLLSSGSSYYRSGMATSSSATSLPSSASSPKTPGLLRCDSHDSQNTTGPRSPLTPALTEHGRRHGCFKEQDFQFEHPNHSGHQEYHMGHDRVRSDSAYFESYEGVSYANRAGLEKGPKRYPCRFRESQGCDKSFTTSGHASRHSKIHTAEKAVRCTHLGCERKFNRADNMKQHLETHYKSKPRDWHRALSRSAVRDSWSRRGQLIKGKLIDYKSRKSS
jgi:hypothetical protein